MRGLQLLILGLAVGVYLTPAIADDEADTKTNLPPIVEHERSDDSSETEILDLGIVEGYRHERNDGHHEVEILDIPFGAVLKAERDKDGETGYRFIHVPFVTVAERKLHDDSNSFRLVDVPFFSLVKTHNDDDGDFDRQVLDIPIFGPLIRHKRQGDKETARFLFFKHSWTAASEDDKDSDEPRRKPRRSNAHPG
jgi:hypothetical protein